MIYLAGPYSKGDKTVRLARFEAITHVAARLIEQRLIVFSPLTMTHPIDLVLAEDGETLGSDFWVEFDEAFMRNCTEIRILMLPGWDESSGVKREIEFFKKRGIAPSYLKPDEFNVTKNIPQFATAFRVAAS